MDLRPDYLEAIDVNFTYPYCNSVKNISVGGTFYGSIAFKQNILMHWLTSVTQQKAASLDPPRYTYFCHSENEILSEYIGVNHNDVICCDYVVQGLCTSPPAVSSLNQSIIAIQIVIAILGAIYAVFLWWSRYTWWQWSLPTPIKYEIPIFKSLVKSNNYFLKHFALVLQKLVLIILGATPLTVCWAISLASMSKSYLIAVTATFFTIISVVGIVWIIAAITWYITIFIFQKFQIPKQIIMSVEIAYFGASCLNILSTTLMVFMFISWTILGLIIGMYLSIVVVHYKG